MFAEQEDGFRFGHVLIRDVAYEAMPKEVRAELHERYPEWIERHAGDRATELEEIAAYHLEQAHRYRTELGHSADERLDELAARAVGARSARAGGRAPRPGRHARRRQRCSSERWRSREHNGGERSLLLTRLGSALMKHRPRSTERGSCSTSAVEQARGRGRPCGWSCARRSSASSSAAFTRAGRRGGRGSVGVAEEAIPELRAARRRPRTLARAWWLLERVARDPQPLGRRAREALEQALARERGPERRRRRQQLRRAARAGALLRADAGARGDRPVSRADAREPTGRHRGRAAATSTLAGAAGHGGPDRRGSDALRGGRSTSTSDSASTSVAPPARISAPRSSSSPGPRATAAVASFVTRTRRSRQWASAASARRSPGFLADVLCGSARTTRTRLHAFTEEALARRRRDRGLRRVRADGGLVRRHRYLGSPAAARGRVALPDPRVTRLARPKYCSDTRTAVRDRRESLRRKGNSSQPASDSIARSIASADDSRSSPMSDEG